MLSKVTEKLIEPNGLVGVAPPTVASSSREATLGNSRLIKLKRAPWGHSKILVDTTVLLYNWSHDVTFQVQEMPIMIILRGFKFFSFVSLLCIIPDTRDWDLVKI